MSSAHQNLPIWLNAKRCCFEPYRGSPRQITDTMNSMNSLIKLESANQFAANSHTEADAAIKAA
ncbi:hypothetical protein MAXJ12_32764 [Mesorhizobium alhagi CCNWXJ12-2]|uniref:Uncharacterized protein n=1 Tax=Mesorhizobium alhagi CCNWXJ12-2 TaxID=1107882 RepID=H0I255_9HYPH|nr:hypothetical protein MAXJ12_32764 [Mesorhizobium alhagi CCNWXJ12-2]